jgi:hypothetical protein
VLPSKYGREPMPFLEIQLVLSPGSQSTPCSSVTGPVWRYLAKTKHRIWIDYWTIIHND